MQRVEEALLVAETLGRVPEEAPEVPLAVDLEAHRRRLRLQKTAESRELTLDLRKPSDREKSQLLRRLALLDVPWGQGGERGEG